MTSTEEVVLGSLFIVAALLLFVWQVMSLRGFARRWASRNGYVFVRLLQTWFRPSPFPPMMKETFVDQAIVHVLVRDRNGNERRCWLRANVLFGFSEDVEVIWED